MIDITEAKRGVTVELDGILYAVIDYQHIKMGRGSAQIRLKLRDVRAGHTTDRTFQSGERLKRADVEFSSAQYLYNDDDFYYFMDQETFDQVPLSGDQLGDGVNYMKEGMIVRISRYKGDAIGVELPITVDLEITETGPSFKGDTATAGSKPAVMETGITVQVPMFLVAGDRVRVDTRTGKYLERA
ncbi:MAG: elongation factor P [Dehalococcoidia bacterium]|nr:elongation factor P [Dehalococcoidia bacterium]